MAHESGKAYSFTLLAAERKGRYTKMPVRLVIERGPYAGLPQRDVLRWARAMLAAVDLSRAELSLVLTDDERIHELNRTYRNKDKPTDVLAFAQREGELGESAGRLLGDVVVSIPTARRQAKARRRAVTAEVTMLIAHGLLHLIGYDHQTEAEDRVMRRETRRLCAAARTAALPAKMPNVNGNSRKANEAARDGQAGRARSTRRTAR
jgi:probable rRNA maturation factor